MAWCSADADDVRKGGLPLMLMVYASLWVFTAVALSAVLIDGPATACYCLAYLGSSATAWPTWGGLLLPCLPEEVCYCLAYLGRSATAWPTWGSLLLPGLPWEVWVVLAYLGRSGWFWPGTCQVQVPTSLSGPFVVLLMTNEDVIGRCVVGVVNT